MSIEETLARVRADLSRLSAAEAAVAAGQPSTYIVDIRPESQRREAGELPGAVVIERNHLEWRLDPGSEARIPEAVAAEIRWIIVCESGYSSSLAAHSLRRIGLVHSTDIIGGFQAWLAAGLPVHHPTSHRLPRSAGEGPSTAATTGGSRRRLIK
jgi:rhodanese-related sulfurtransferase